MKQAFLIAGALTLAFTAAPAAAKPGKGHGNHGKHVAHGQSHGGQHGYGIGGCPPGLAKKGCMPPGQAKKLYNVGQRYPSDYGSRYAYDRIPYDLRRQYDLDREDNYYYGDGYIYQVDPRTQLIQQVLGAILR